MSDRADATLVARAPLVSARAKARLIWLRVHRWIGLAMLVVFLAIAITGLGLVWRGTTEALFHPDRVPGRNDVGRADASMLVQDAIPAIPGGALPVQLQLQGPTGAAILTGKPNGPPIMGVGPPRRPRVWIDPADGRVLGVSSGGPDVVFVMKVIHGHLLAGEFGRWLMAASGMLLFLSTATGFYLWWPGRRNILRSLRWRRQVSRSMNLHRIVGPPAALGLAMQGLTGIFMALPWLFAFVGPSAVSRAAPPPGVADPLPVQQRGIDEVVRSATKLEPDADLVTIQFPTVADHSWWLKFEGGVDIGINDRTGRTEIRRPSPPSIAQRAEQMTIALHEGRYGSIHRLLLFATGLAFCLFTITGMLLWWRGRGRAIR